MRLQYGLPADTGSQCKRAAAHAQSGQHHPISEQKKLLSQSYGVGLHLHTSMQSRRHRREELVIQLMLCVADGFGASAEDDDNQPLAGINV
jgi:hypothetical protein